MSFRSSVAAVLAILALAGAPLAPHAQRVSIHEQPIPLDVSFRLTDLEFHALPNVPVRLVFGSQRDWQGASTGKRFVTDAKGEARFAAKVALDIRQRKYPTNFWSSLGSLPQPTHHLTVGAELEFAGFQWLYAVDLFRYPNGDTMSDGIDVYTPDANGRFTHKARYDGRSWKMRDLKGMLLTHPGYDLGDFVLAPDPSDPSGKQWMLSLTLRKSAPPVRR